MVNRIWHFAQLLVNQMKHPKMNYIQCQLYMTHIYLIIDVLHSLVDLWHSPCHLLAHYLIHPLFTLIHATIKKQHNTVLHVPHLNLHFYILRSFKLSCMKLSMFLYICFIFLCVHMPPLIYTLDIAMSFLHYNKLTPPHIFSVLQTLYFMSHFPA